MRSIPISRGTTVCFVDDMAMAWWWVVAEKGALTSESVSSPITETCISRDVAQRDLRGKRGAVRLRHGHALRKINARVPAEEVGEEARGRDIDAVRRAEKLDAHERAGHRRIGRAGKDGHEAQRGEEVGRRAEPAGSALPSAAPMKNSGVTSPPLKPALSVAAVKTIFHSQLHDEFPAR